MMKEVVLTQDKIHSGTLLLVNSHCPLKFETREELLPANINYPDILINRDVATALQTVLNKVSAGNNIVPVSGYRSIAEQAEIYNNSLIENGEIFTRKFVALQGRSEHQTGLAIDLALNKDEIDFICPDFPYEGICDVFRQVACDYGFIERYPKDKETITGISHEPWHFRYVGYPHSKIIQQKGICFEEYISFVKNYRNDCKLTFMQENGKAIEIFYVPARNDKTEITISDNCIYDISGNNIDGFIVTLWRKDDDET